jgi:hypothetical protein
MDVVLPVLPDEALELEKELVVAVRELLELDEVDGGFGVVVGVAEVEAVMDSDDVDEELDSDVAEVVEELMAEAVVDGGVNPWLVPEDEEVSANFCVPVEDVEEEGPVTAELEVVELPPEAEPDMVGEKVNRRSRNKEGRLAPGASKGPRHGR